MGSHNVGPKPRVMQVPKAYSSGTCNAVLVLTLMAAISVVHSTSSGVTNEDKLSSKLVYRRSNGNFLRFGKRLVPGEDYDSSEVLEDEEAAMADAAAGPLRLERRSDN